MRDPKPVPTTEITEQDLVEAKEDQTNLEALHGHLAELLKHERAADVAVAARRLIDAGIEPLVIAKTMLIGDRAASALYRIACKATALGSQETAAETVLAIALRDLPPHVAAHMLVAGATWLAEQCGIERPFLRSLVANVERRPFPNVCPGALDYVDAKAVATRAWLLDAIDHARLPTYAPLGGA